MSARTKRKLLSIIVAFFDIDGTLYRDNFSLRLIEVLLEREYIDPMHCEDLLLVLMKWRAREATYEHVTAELSRVTKVAMEGVYLDDLIAAGAIAATHGKHRPYIFTRTLFEILSEGKKPTKRIAISGSPIAVVEPYGKEFGFDQSFATYFKLDDGRVTGGFDEATSPYHTKDKVCLEVAAELGLEVENGTIAQSLAIGDAYADLKMLRVVEYPIAFNPTQKLLAECRTYNIPVVIERKDVISIQMTPWGGKNSAFAEVTIETILPKGIAARMRELIPGLY